MCSTTTTDKCTSISVIWDFPFQFQCFYLKQNRFVKKSLGLFDLEFNNARTSFLR